MRNFLLAENDSTIRDYQVDLKPLIPTPFSKTGVNQVSSTQRVSSMFDILQLNVVINLRDLTQSIWSCRIVPNFTKFLQNFWLTLLVSPLLLHFWYSVVKVLIIVVSYAKDYYVIQWRFWLDNLVSYQEDDQGTSPYGGKNQNLSQGCSACFFYCLLIIFRERKKPCEKSSGQLSDFLKKNSIFVWNYESRIFSVFDWISGNFC